MSDPATPEAPEAQERQYAVTDENRCRCTAGSQHTNVAECLECDPPDCRTFAKTIDRDDWAAFHAHDSGHRVWRLTFPPFKLGGAS